MPGDPLPFQFGKYSLIERIAVGGMAEVYRAKTYGAAGFEKDLVIKRILEKFSGDEEFVRMFIDEARLVARLQHPNLVQIFDFDRVPMPGGPSYYIAMEWVDGRDLRQLLREMVRQHASLSFASSVHIAIETLRGLHYAHARTDGGQPLEIVHRDVSPHNILISYSGDVKLSDFGIAKAAARASQTTNGMVKGKLAYMSPEQISGRPLDRRTDVFSLGIVLYEMLTRTRLFAGESESDVVRRVRDGLVPPPRARNPAIPPDLEQVLLRMLARDPAARYQTAADAARALAVTGVHSPTEALSLGEFVASLFPPSQKRGAASPAPPGQPARKSEKMADQSSPPPGKPPQGNDGAATMMLEAPQAPAPPPGAPIADQRTAIADATTPQVAAVQAQIAEARGRSGAGAPPPASAPSGGAVQEQKTAILDVGSPQMAAVQAQLGDARGRAAAGAPPAAPPRPAPALTDQKTAILDAHAPQMAAVQAQIAGAMARQGGGGAAGSDQRTAILDVGAAGLGALGGSRGGTAGPGAGGQRTMALDVGGHSSEGGARRPQQSLSPLALAGARAPSGAWVRWVVGPALSLATASVTFGAARLVVPRHAIEKSFEAPPPPPVPMGRIKLETSPPGASVTVDGKPHSRFTPTEIEGPIGETAIRIIVKLDGYAPKQQDVLFAAAPQRLALVLERAEPFAEPKRGGKHGRESREPRGARSGIGLVADKGQIGIFVEPQASVVIDGQGVGKTPLGAVTLTPGVHTIELVNDALGKRESVRVEVKAGDNPPIRRNWNR